MADPSDKATKAKKNGHESQEQLDSFTVLQDTVEADLDADAVLADEAVLSSEEIFGSGLLNVAPDQRDDVQLESTLSSR